MGPEDREVQWPHEPSSPAFSPDWLHSLRAAQHICWAYSYLRASALAIPSTWNAVPPNDQVLACSWLNPVPGPDPCPNITSSVRPSMTHLSKILNESLIASWNALLTFPAHFFFSWHLILSDIYKMFYFFGCFSPIAEDKFHEVRKFCWFSSCRRRNISAFAYVDQCLVHKRSQKY